MCHTVKLKKIYSYYTHTHTAEITHLLIHLFFFITFSGDKAHKCSLCSTWKASIRITIPNNHISCYPLIQVVAGAIPSPQKNTTLLKSIVSYSKWVPFHQKLYFCTRNSVKNCLRSQGRTIKSPTWNPCSQTGAGHSNTTKMSCFKDKWETKMDQDTVWKTKMDQDTVWQRCKKKKNSSRAAGCMCLCNSFLTWQYNKSETLKKGQNFQVLSVFNFKCKL